MQFLFCRVSIFVHADARPEIWNEFVEKEFGSPNDSLIDWRATSFQVRQAQICLSGLKRSFNTKSILDEVMRNPETFKHNLKMRKIKIDVDRIIRLAESDASSAELSTLLRALPNLAHSSVADATSPIELEEFGQKYKSKKRMIEFARGHGVLNRGQQYTTICGDRTYYLVGDLARLERALVRFTLDRLKKHDFRIISVPDLLHPDEMADSGAQVRGQRSQVYRARLNKERQLCLSGTSEHALANLFRGKSFGKFASVLRSS